MVVGWWYLLCGWDNTGQGVRTNDIGMRVWWQAGVVCLGLPETMNRPLLETMKALEADEDVASTLQPEPSKEDTHLRG